MAGGPNKNSTAAGEMTDLGFTWIGNNAEGNPSTKATLISGGIQGKQWKAGSFGESGLVNESVKTNDTILYPFDGAGTVMGGGPNP